MILLSLYPAIRSYNVVPCENTDDPNRNATIAFQVNPDLKITKSLLLCPAIEWDLKKVVVD